MTLIPWRNKRDDRHNGGLTPLADLRREMDRLFENFFGGWDEGEESPGALAAWSPSVDVEETEREVTVRAEVPGVDPKDIDVRVLDDQLTVAGEKKETTEKREGNVYRRESHYGSFRRTVRLPAGVDPEKVSADYSNGVLTVHLQKSPTAQPKRIAVKTAAAASGKSKG
jgi:HSP20 family protein